MNDLRERMAQTLAATKQPCPCEDCLDAVVVLSLLDEVERLDRQWQDIADKASRTIARLEAEIGRLNTLWEEAKDLLLKPNFICGRCPQIGRIVEAALNSSPGGGQ